MIKDPREKIEDVLAFCQTLTPESDRGCALIAAAYLDAQLDELLRAALVDNAKSLFTISLQSLKLW